MPASSPSANTPCAGAMPSASSTSSTPSPTSSGPPGRVCATSFGWWFYAGLKAYRREPNRRRRAELRARFDRLFGRHTGFVILDRLLERLHANKAELLRVLERPEIDRKSTRLNSSHANISYAVFCLKKKN